MLSKKTLVLTTLSEVGFLVSRQSLTRRKWNQTEPSIFSMLKVSEQWTAPVHMMGETEYLCASRVLPKLLTIRLDKTGTESKSTEGQGIMCLLKPRLITNWDFRNWFGRKDERLCEKLRCYWRICQDFSSPTLSAISHLSSLAFPEREEMKGQSKSGESRQVWETGKEREQMKKKLPMRFSRNLCCPHRGKLVKREGMMENWLKSSLRYKCMFF